MSAVVILRPSPMVKLGLNEKATLVFNGERLDLPYNQEVEVSDSAFDALCHSSIAHEVVSSWKREAEPERKVEAKKQ